MGRVTSHLCIYRNKAVLLCPTLPFNGFRIHDFETVGQGMIFGENHQIIAILLCGRSEQAIEIQKCQGGPDFLSSHVVAHAVVFHIDAKSFQADAGQPESL